MRIFVPHLRSSPASRSASKTPNRSTPRDEFESPICTPVTMDVRRTNLVRTISRKSSIGDKSDRAQITGNSEKVQTRVTLFFSHAPSLPRTWGCGGWYGAVYTSVMLVCRVVVQHVHRSAIECTVRTHRAS